MGDSRSLYTKVYLVMMKVDKKTPVSDGGSRQKITVFEILSLQQFMSS